MKSIAIIRAVLFTFILMLAYEAAKEYVFKGTLTPWESHSITILFTTTLALVVALVTSNYYEKLKNRELEIQLKEEKLKSIKQMLHISQHHINNLVNCMSLLEIELNKGKTPDKQIVAEIFKQINESSRQINKLDLIDDPFDESSLSIKLD